MATIDVITTIERFYALKPVWDNLYSRNRHNRVFQSFDWNMVVWEGFHMKRMPDESLFIIYAKQEGSRPREVILPCSIDKRGCLRLIGHGMTDVLSEISPPHTDNWHDFYLQIVRFLQANSLIKSILFFNLEDTSELLRYFGVYWKDAVILKCDAISFFQAKQSENIAEAIPHLLSTERSNIKRLAKKWQEYDFVIYSKKEGREYPLSQLTALRRWMIEHRLRVSAAIPVEYIAVMNRLYDMHKCEISCLVDKRDGSFVYAAYRLLGCENVVFWVIFYKDCSMTACGDARYILEKMKYAPLIFDFGTGVYPYKLSNFLPQVQFLYSVSVHPMTAVNLVLDLYWLIRRYLKVFLVFLSLVKPRR